MREGSEGDEDARGREEEGEVGEDEDGDEARDDEDGVFRRDTAGDGVPWSASLLWVGFDPEVERTGL